MIRVTLPFSNGNIRIGRGEYAEDDLRLCGLAAILVQSGHAVRTNSEITEAPLLKPASIDLSNMTKGELLDYAKTIGLDLSPRLKVAEIKREIEAIQEGE